MPHVRQQTDAVINQGPSVHQTTYQLMCDALADLLPEDADEMRSVPGRAVAALFVLLKGHPVDRQGRCWSCRRPGAIFGLRRRRCQVHVCVSFWLHQPDRRLLLRRLARELAQPAARRPDDSRGGATQTTAVPPSRPPRECPKAGRPDLDHGGAGEPNPERPRLRRGPEHPPPTEELPRRFDSADWRSTR